MGLRIEDYGLVGDTHTVALVGVDGSVDWLCLPRIDSDACFAALLGQPDHGRWALAPAGGSRPVGRRYRPDTLVLETDLANDQGVVRLIDFMPLRGDFPTLVRRVEGLSGRVDMSSELCLRFDYGKVEPWIHLDGGRVHAAAGPDLVTFDGADDTEITRGVCRSRFTVSQGEHIDLQMSYRRPGQQTPPRLDVDRVLRQTQRWWERWMGGCTYDGPYEEAVRRSMVILKALSYAPTGGIAAAGTTSLPEQLGGVRNWDYRYCWLRDATYTLMALLDAGFRQEAIAWREWLLRALAGQPAQMQIMYGIDGRRRLHEVELDWLPGYADSRPVRVGNAASEQFQLDVYGELMDSLYQARAHDIAPDESAWAVERALMDFLESHWDDPDNGVWEMRGPRRDFTHSKMMAWVGVDRAVRAVERYGVAGPVDRWRALRQQIFDEVCEKGYDSRRRTFTMYYGSKALDSALLLMPAVGFLPANDKRVKGTIEAIEKNLCTDGFVQRYTMNAETEGVDGLPPGEASFLMCSFWLADAYALQGRTEQGRRLYEQMLDLRNDLGILSEEYDTNARRLIGNVPQAYSHVGVINTAFSLGKIGAAQKRARLAGKAS